MINQFINEIKKVQRDNESRGSTLRYLGFLNQSLKEAIDSFSEAYCYKTDCSECRINVKWRRLQCLRNFLVDHHKIIKKHTEEFRKQ